VVLVGAVTLAGSYGYSKWNEDDFYSLANSARPQSWARLGGGYGAEYYLCQQLIDGKYHARAVVVKAKDVSPLAISVQTYSDAEMKQPVAFASNQQGNTYVYWGGEISAPAARLPMNGWVQVMIAGQKFPAAQYFIPGCDDNTAANLRRVVR